jgi:hypothetical protein
VCAFIKAFGFFTKLSRISNWRLSRSNQGFGFSKSFRLFKSGLLAVAFFQVWRFQKLAFVFLLLAFFFNFLRSLKSASWLGVKFGQASGFILQNPVFVAKVILCKVRSPKLASRFLAKVSASLFQAFFARFIFSGKVNFSQSQFLAKVLASSRLWRSSNSMLVSLAKSGL